MLGVDREVQKGAQCKGEVSVTHSLTHCTPHHHHAIFCQGLGLGYLLRWGWVGFGLRFHVMFGLWFHAGVGLRFDSVVRLRFYTGVGLRFHAGVELRFHARMPGCLKQNIRL